MCSSAKEEPESNPSSPVKPHSPDSVIINSTSINGECFFFYNTVLIVEVEVVESSGEREGHPTRLDPYWKKHSQEGKIRATFFKRVVYVRFISYKHANASAIIAYEDESFVEPTYCFPLNFTRVDFFP